MPLRLYSEILRYIVNVPRHNFAWTISTVLVTCHPHARWNHWSWTRRAGSACTHVYFVRDSDSRWRNKSFHLWPNPLPATDVRCDLQQLALNVHVKHTDLVTKTKTAFHPSMSTKTLSSLLVHKMSINAKGTTFFGRNILMPFWLRLKVPHIKNVKTNKHQ